LKKRNLFIRQKFLKNKKKLCSNNTGFLELKIRRNFYNAENIINFGSTFYVDNKTILKNVNVLNSNGIIIIPTKGLRNNFFINTLIYYVM